MVRVVERQSQQAGAAAPTGRAIAQSSAPNATPDVDRFLGETRREYANVEAPSVMTPVNMGEVQALQSMLGQLVKVADTATQVSRQEAYLSGIAHATTGGVIDELESSPVTSDWARAGFGDTTAKLAMAQAEAELAREMPTLREQSPDQFAAVLDARRRDLLARQGNMSRSGREAMLQQIVASDQAAILRHGEEHAKFILDQRARAIQVDMSTQASLLTASKGQPSYGAQSTAYLASLYGATMQDDTLPLGMRQNLLYEGLAHAISTGNIGVYERAMQTPIKTADGKTASPVEQLSFQQQMALGAAYRTEVGRQKQRLGLDMLNQMTFMEAGWNDPNQPIQQPEEVLSFYGNLYNEGYISEEQYNSKVKGYHGKLLERNKQTIGANAFATNDTAALVRNDITPEEGAKALLDRLVAEGVSPGSAVTQLMTLGAQGQPAAFKVAGEFVGKAFQSLGYRETLDPADAEILENTLNQLDALAANGDVGARHMLLSGMPEDAALLAMLYDEARRGGSDASTSARFARDSYLEAKKFTPAQRAAGTAAKATDIRKYTESLEAQGMFGRLWQWGSSMVTGTPTRDSALRPDQTIWESLPFTSKRTDTQFQLSQLRSAMTEEMDYIAGLTPFATLDSIRDKAMNRVLARTVPTEYGNLYLPRGTSIQSFFGVEQTDATPGRVGKGLNSIIQDTDVPFEAVTMAVNNQGNLEVRYYSEDDVPVDSRVISPESIRAVLQEKREAEAQAAADREGMSSRKDGVNYDGRNSAGVPVDTAQAFRSNLITSEGVKTKVYKDTAGVLTVGVGVSERNTFWPSGLKEGDEISPAQVSHLFAQASNEALADTWKYMGRQRVTGKDWTLLLSELRYQSGSLDGQEPVSSMLSAARQGNPTEALDALRQTRAYRAAGDSRKAHYERLLKRALTGR